MAKETLTEVVYIWDERHNLANFGDVSVSIHGGRLVFPTSEHLYQFCKFYPAETKIRGEIANAKSPYRVKEIVKEDNDKIRRDWTSELEERMISGVIRLKVRQNPDLQKELLDTGEREIVELTDEFAPKNPDRETIEYLRRWGKYKGEGENLIGEILMRLRSELRESGKV